MGRAHSTSHAGMRHSLSSVIGTLVAEARYLCRVLLLCPKFIIYSQLWLNHSQTTAGCVWSTV